MSGTVIWDSTKKHFSKASDQQKSSRDLSLISSFKFIEEWLSDQPNFQQKTSGSTGQPKIISIQRNQMVASAQRTGQALKLAENTTALLCINPDFIGGKMMIVRAIELGWKLIHIPPSSDLSAHLDIDQKFDFAAMVPLQVENLLNSEKGIAILNNVSKLIIGGASVSQKLVERLQTIKTQVFSTYGMTETVSHIALKRLNGAEKSDFFELLPGVEAKLDQRDCLALKADVTQNEWIQTNDVVNLKGEKFQWLGRADFVINSGGIKIHLDQLEEKIKSLLNTDLALIKTLHEKYGESYAAVIASTNLNLSEDEVLSRLKLELPKYHAPAKVQILEKLPLTPSGKVDRQKIKSLL